MHPIILTKQMKVLVIGGGRAATTKLKRLQTTYDDITCLAIEINIEIVNSAVTSIQKNFYDTDLEFYEDFDIIYFSHPYPIETHLEKIFLKTVAHILEAGKLLSVSSKPQLGNFISPATRRHRNISVSVSTGGESPKKAVALADLAIKTIQKQDI